MEFKVINNFLSKSECSDLVSDGKKFSHLGPYSKINTNRNSLNSSSLSFMELCKNSKCWNELSEKLQSQFFFDECFEKLKIEKTKYKIKKFYNRRRNSKTINFFKKIGLSQVQSIRTFSLMKYILLRFFLNIEKKIKFNFITSLFKKPIELLYDYSVAGKGYSREIHRDSDSRLVVFLIYLNKLENKAETGGQLEIYKNKNKLDRSAQPNRDNCELVESIEPEIGKLIIFQNTDESFHAVKKIEDSNTERHFIYGAYTLLSGKNPFIKKSTKLKTDFNFYE